MQERADGAIRDLLASASIFSTAVDEVMAARLAAVAGDRITFAQLKVLTLVAHTRAIGVSDVATFLGVSPAAASKAVARLAENGLLERSAHPGDRRAQHLSVTGDGRALLDTYEEATTEALGRLFGHLDPVRLRRLAVSLDRLSLAVVEGRDEDDADACFRCGIYFRDRCLLRGAPGNRICYQHLGAGDDESAVTAAR
jgi:DNA-binding MarR family transcriptional regulator